jgi:hypothetical protein
MGKRREDNLRFVERRVLRRDISHFGSSNAVALAPLLIGRSEGEFELGVPRDQPAQLSARISTCTEDSDRNFMHK